jgi:predicted phosphatase
MFGQKSKEYSSPLEKGDHPELDTSHFIDLEGIKIYQSMIGVLQWVVPLERCNVLKATMIMSGFHVIIIQGHLDRLKMIYGFL